MEDHDELDLPPFPNWETIVSRKGGAKKHIIDSFFYDKTLCGRPIIHDCLRCLEREDRKPYISEDGFRRGYTERYYYRCHSDCPLWRMGQKDSQTCKTCQRVQLNWFHPIYEKRIEGDELADN